MLRHVVLFRWKPETSADKIKEIEEAVRALPAKISQIVAFEWGRNISVQGFSQGYTHCLVVSFASEADRDIYAPHPDHAAFIALSRPHVEGLLVVDYFTGS